MAATPLITAPLVVSGAETFHWISLLVPVGVGLTMAALTGRDGAVAERARLLAVPAAGLALVGALVQFFVTPAESGVLPLLQFLGTLLVAAGLVALRNRPSPGVGWGIVVIAVLAAVVPELPTSALSVNAVAKFLLVSTHITGMLVWVGGLAVLAIVGVVSRRSRTEDSGGEWAQIWQRFSVVALVTVGAMIVSGSWLLWTHVGTVGQMFSTSYGRYLTVKLVFVIALLLIGAYNTRVLIPKIVEAQRNGDSRSVVQLAVERFPRVVTVETVVALAVLVVVPWLHGSARAQAGGPAARPFDVTVFGTGVLLVALVAFAMWAGTRTSRLVGAVTD